MSEAGSHMTFKTSVRVRARTVRVPLVLVRTVEGYAPPYNPCTQEYDDEQGT